MLTVNLVCTEIIGRGRKVNVESKNYLKMSELA